MKILIAEDEKDMSKAICAILNHQGYETDVAFDGLKALELAQSNTYDCMVFDIMMPKMDGLEALKRIRAGGDMTPVIMLTAKAQVDDRVEGLDAGADDYLTKPFAMKELIARIKSLTRRNTSYNPSRITLGSVSLDTETQEMSAGNSISMAKKETRLMEMLMRNPGKKFSTSEIYDRIWNEEEDRMENQESEELVWLYISYLRRKLIAINADLNIEGEKGSRFCLVTH